MTANSADGLYDFQRGVIAEFRANGGRVGGMFAGSTLCLLTTTGARTGNRHTVPLGFMELDEQPLVVASAGGADTHPAWYFNVLTDPVVTVETGDDTYVSTAVLPDGDERDRLFDAAVRRAPGYADYQAGTSRVIPVLVLPKPTRTLTLTTAVREVRLRYARHGERVVVVADGEPDWYSDVLAHPAVQVDLGDEHYVGVAVPSSRVDGPVQVTLDRLSIPDEPVEVRNMADKLVQIHAWLRAQLHAVRAETEAYFASGDRAVPLGLQLRQYCLAFCEGLHGHHAGEDAVMFPDLARNHPHLREPLRRLTEQHGTVARIQAELQAMLADIAGADPASFRSEVDRMTTELTKHLDDEEDALLGVLAEIPFPPV